MGTHKSRKLELDGGEAFVRDPRYGFTPITDGDAEAFGEEFIAAATSNEPVSELARDEAYADELVSFVFETDDEELVDVGDFM